ncbi:DUF4253 domain-containing protein [Streptomyces sp. NPDC001530]|uniref:DUF4253 domain-containing protein n=1 Tax=Streptomyces sp. NPDC001530 TaxID=3364582 RepID=UPI00368AE95A
MVPAAHGYELPALIDAPYTVNWAGPREHPDLTPADHVAVLRSWHDRYGARNYYLGSTAVELTVAAPPTAPGEVARVAVEQYA